MSDRITAAGLRQEAESIESGSPDKKGYEYWLRDASEKIDDLVARLKELDEEYVDPDPSLDYSAYRSDPFHMRVEARDIMIGAPDGDGYAGWLRDAADRIDDLEARISTAESEPGPGM